MAVITSTTRVAGWALVVALFVLPLFPKIGLVPVTGTYIPVRFDDLTIAVVALAWLAALWAGRRRPVLPRLIALAAGAWLIAGLVSLVVGAFVLQSISPITGFAFWAKPIEYLVLGAVAYDLVSVGALSARNLLTAVLASASLVVAYALLEHFGVLPHMPGVVITPGVATSFFGDPHELSAYLGIVTLLVVAMWTFVTARWARPAVLVGAIACVAVMYFTGARSEFFVLALILVVLALAWRGARPSALVGVAAIALLFVSAFALRPPPGEPNVTTRSTQDVAASLYTRLAVKWPELLGGAMRSPIVGLGPSAATEAADGYYVRAFVESGILGLAAFVGLVASVGYSLFRRVKSVAGFRFSMAVGALAATFFVALVAILIDTWVASRVMDLYWPIVGLALARYPPTSSGLLPGPATSPTN